MSQSVFPVADQRARLVIALKCWLLSSTMRRGRRLEDASLLLLHDNGQIHTSMNGAIEFEGASRRKRTDGTGTVAVDLHIFDWWCAWFVGGSGLSVLPGAIGDDVRREGRGDQCNAFSFFDGNGGLLKLRIVHLYLVAGNCLVRSIRRSAAGHKEQREHAAESYDEKHFLQHTFLTIFLSVRPLVVRQAARPPAV